MKSILNYLVLPNERSEFEDAYLSRMNRVGLWFFVAHLPLFAVIAAVNDTGPLLASLLTSAVLAGPLLAVNLLQSKRAVSIVMGVTAMLMGGLLVHFGQGPIQIEMHFYFFVLLALLAVYANPMVIVAAAVTAAAHHAVLWLLLPASVFNYEAPIWVVGVHALFVVLESVAACFIARSFFDNVVGLEKIVAARTSEVESRNKDMRMLLDAVAQGFFTVDQNGVMSEERSSAVDRWLGTPQSDSTFADLVRPLDKKVADWLEFGIEDVFESIMPAEVTIDQLPKRFVAGKRTLSIEYTPVEVNGALTALAIVISDITPDVEREKLESENREMMAMIERISEDKIGFMEFYAEADGLIESLRQDSRDDLILVKRRVHTLKGNCALFGLDRVAAACHTIEDHIAENSELPAGPAWTTMFGCWASVRGHLRRLIGEESPGITIEEDEYDRVLQALIGDTSKDILATRMAGWGLEPTQDRMERIAGQARSLSRRLGKGDVEIDLKGGRLRTDTKHWGAFWAAFVHVLRNAVDHGIESPADRLLVGKSEAGRLTLKTEVVDGQYIVSLADDGRGIDWDRVRDLAFKAGLDSATSEDLVNALFADGLSTAESITDTSGRGVGMSAVRNACEELGGTIEIDSEANAGTTIRFKFKADQMAPDMILLLNEHGIDTPERSTLGAPLSV